MEGMMVLMVENGECDGMTWNWQCDGVGNRKLRMWWS